MVILAVVVVAVVVVVVVDNLVLAQLSSAITLQ